MAKKKRMCEARYYNGQRICDRCDMQWDAKDSRPRCKTGLELFTYIKDKLKWLNKKR